MTAPTLPVTDTTSDPFWAGARAGKLMIQRCPATLRYQWYPRAHSIHAPGVTPEWVEASGRGSVFSFSTIHRGNGPVAAPYT
ncbi:Zn-ribbon domain-containing OB-fold protein, partial [Bosea sp. (in: a-proteobacteria)]|uniref:Zn-ribbon domain-containing OB-fold protein n=1 Tax=Bosea sp. (in: a-proteobacteria) TaxID=1871050 RepID=UPI003F725038